MSGVYDSWERLVGPVLKREELRRLARSESLSSSISASSSRQSNFSYRDAQRIEFKEILKATKNFQPDLFIGRGVLCQVFKAWIDEHTLTASKPGSGMAVAVKRWDPIGLARHQDWVKEINYLNELRHPNLVELVGYCSEEDSMILVHEFLPKGSLENQLIQRGHQSLPWATRIKVAIDVARGLSYLHGKEIPVIHRDFKTANILLDGTFNAKLSNYWYGTDDPTGNMTHVSTEHVLLTDGYISPECEARGQLTTKSNVYTFGVVLLELLSGIPAFDITRPMEKLNLLHWAKPYFGDKRKLLQIMDSRLEGQYSHEAAYKVAKLALQCLSYDPKKRPKMAEVVVALEQL